MKIINTSVNRPIGVLMIVIAILLMGGIALRNLYVDLYPDLKIPVAVVTTVYEGAAPKEVENLVSKPLEASIGTLEGIKRLQSVSSPEASLVIVEYDWGTNLDARMLDLREKIDLVEGILPDDAEDPQVIRIDPQSFPVIRLSVGGDIEPVRLTNLVEDVIESRLERTEGVASVALIGSQEEEIRIEVSTSKLNSYGISLDKIIQTLQRENITTSAGEVKAGSQDLLLRVNGEYKDVEEIKATLISLPYEGTVKLGEIANVEKTYKENNTIAKMDGKPSLSMDIFKKSDGNTVAVADEIYKSIEEIKPLLPEGVNLEIVYDLSIYIRQSIDNVVKNMVIGGILATIILLLFLRNFRATIVIAVAMPIAVISTFILLYFTGQTLNLLTLGGLALGIGMMVDSSIVILENIYSYRERGYGLKEAAIEGAKEVGPAVIASTLTSVVVFLPIVFVQGLAAELFRPLALTVTFSLLASLLVSIAFVPMLSSRLLKNINHSNHSYRKFGIYNITAWFERLLESLINWYKSLLVWALRHRKTVVFGTLALIILSFALIPKIGTEFIPSGDQGEVNIDITLPVGTDLGETERVIDSITEKVIQVEEVKTIFSTSGSGNQFRMGSDDSHIGNLYVRLNDLEVRDRTIDEVMEDIRSRLADFVGAEIIVSAFNSGSGMPSSDPIQVNIRGFDLNVLQDLAFIIQEEIKAVEGTRNVENTLEEGRPEIQVLVDRDVAAEYGLTYSQIMSTIKTAFEGETATEYRKDGDEIDIVVILPKAEREKIDSLKDLTILTPSGINVPLTKVAKLEQVQGPAQIVRTDQQREVSITSDIIGRDLGSISKEIKERISNLPLPDGYYITYGGQAQDAQDSFKDLIFALILSIFLVYMVMAVQFEALLSPLVIMFSMPATVIGIVIGLVLMGHTLSITAFIGIIMLAGIVVNNAIVLIDYINILRRRGINREEAIISAGASRLRPILMTTLTTILALIPLIFDKGQGSETQGPFATVVSFGLSFSTLITLVFIPVVYTLFDDLESYFKDLFTEEGRKRLKERKKLRSFLGGKS